MLSWRFLQILSLPALSLSVPPCLDYSVDDCVGDEGSEIIQFVTGDQTKCQQHSAIFEASFYAYYLNPIQSVDCHIFKEPFSAYLNHCDIRRGTRSDGKTGNCLKPDENSCEVEQWQDCTAYGVAIETNVNLPTPEDCQRFCDINEECKMWQWSREKNSCDLYDSAEKGCNIKFGPANFSPGDCGSTTPAPPTPDPNQSTPAPNVCDIQCPPTGLEIFPDCDNCGKYYECFNGVLSSTTCPNCYLYDEDNGYCNQPSQVDCGGRPVDDNCVAPTLPGDCPFSFGYFEDKHDCDQYVICQNGVAEIQSCVNNTFSGLYNYEKEWCDFPNRVECGDRPICRGPGEYTACQCQGAPIEQPASCQGSTTPEYKNDPFNCQHYIVCQGGAMVYEDVCTEGTYWDLGSVSCVSNNNVCGGRPVCGDASNSADCVCV